MTRFVFWDGSTQNGYNFRIVDKDLLILDKQFSCRLARSHHANYHENIFSGLRSICFVFPIFKKLEKDAWFAKSGAILTILLADGITSQNHETILWAAKTPARPKRSKPVAFVVQLERGNLHAVWVYGFASSHAVNTFGTATFMCCCFAIKQNWPCLYLAVLYDIHGYILGVHYRRHFGRRHDYACWVELPGINCLGGWGRDMRSWQFDNCQPGFIIIMHILPNHIKL